MKYVLIGAGCHAKVVYEISIQNNINCAGFIDPLVVQFKNIKKMEEQEVFEYYFLGIGGVTILQLNDRNLLYNKYKHQGYCSLKICSLKAHISKSAVIGDGTLVSHGSIIQPDVIIGENVIINTNAIIEHDVVIGNSVHIAPGAIILGGSSIGDQCMIGAGAVVLPNQQIPPNTLIPSLTRC